MNDQETAHTLDALLYVDQMTVRLYDEAIARVDEETSATLQKFRDDHQKHVERLQQWSSQKGRQAEQPASDVTALVDEHARVMRASTGQDAAMEALLLAERTNAMLYSAAEDAQTGADIGKMLADFHFDEQRHVSYVEGRVPVLVGMPSAATMGDGHDIACMTGGMTDDKNPDDFE